MHLRSEFEQQQPGPFAGSDNVWQVLAPGSSGLGEVLSWDPTHASDTNDRPGFYTIGEPGMSSRFPNFWNSFGGVVSSAAAQVDGGVVVLAEHQDGTSTAYVATFPQNEVSRPAAAPAQQPVCVAVSSSGPCLLAGSTFSGFAGQPLGLSYYTITGKRTIDLREAAYSLDCESPSTCRFETDVPLPQGPQLENSASELDDLLTLLYSLLAPFSSLPTAAPSSGP